MDYLSDFDEHIKYILDKNLDISFNLYKQKYPKDNTFVELLKN